MLRHQSRKGRTWSLIPSFLSQQGYPCSSREQHYKFTGVPPASPEEWLSAADGHGGEIKVADLA
jgi:hypothetical protein